MSDDSVQTHRCDGVIVVPEVLEKDSVQGAGTVLAGLLASAVKAIEDSPDDEITAHIAASSWLPAVTPTGA